MFSVAIGVLSVVWQYRLLLRLFVVQSLKQENARSKSCLRWISLHIINMLAVLSLGKTNTNLHTDEL